MGVTLLPVRFRQAVITHMLRCFSMDASLGAPQILAIVGRPGTGKTFQLGAVLSEAQVVQVPFGAEEVDSRHANEPIVRLHERMNRVSQLLANRQPAALVFDDVDLLLGRFAETQYTHNLQRLNAELMKVANAIWLGNAEAQAMPIFMVGNDLGKLHQPLLRSGRARTLHWDPSREELAGMVAGLFPELTGAEAFALVSDFPGRTIAFFAALRATLIDAYWALQLDGTEPACLLRDTLETPDSRPELRFGLSEVQCAAMDLASTEDHNIASVQG